MENITIIIPVAEYNDERFANALKSIPSDVKNIFAVGNEVKHSDDKRVKIINSNGATDFATLINLALKECKTEYFGILDSSDAFTNIWFKNLGEYINAKPDFSAFLPLILNKKYDTKEIAGMGNEIAWASAFCEDLGVINNEALKNYPNFYINGGVFKTEDVINLGCLKPSFGIVSPYEFLLRLTYNGKKVVVIPKIGCEHYFGFETKTDEEITPEHMDWLIKTAQQEMFYKEDRNIEYSPKAE